MHDVNTADLLFIQFRQDHVESGQRRQLKPKGDELRERGRSWFSFSQFLDDARSVPGLHSATGGHIEGSWLPQEHDVLAGVLQAVQHGQLAALAGQLPKRGGSPAPRRALAQQRGALASQATLSAGHQPSGTLGWPPVCGHQPGPPALLAVQHEQPAVAHYTALTGNPTP